MEFDNLSNRVIGLAIEVHNEGILKNGIKRFMGLLSFVRVNFHNSGKNAVNIFKQSPKGLYMKAQGNAPWGIQVNTFLALKEQYRWD